VAGAILENKQNPTNTPVTSVPYSTINRFEPHFISTWLDRVETLTRSTQFINGDKVKNLELRLAKEAQTKEARVCANGTDALQLALRAVGVQPGDIVLIPDSTFWATFEAVCNVGARPVTVDVDINDLHISEEHLAEAIHRFSPKAIILVHLYGWAAKDTLAIRSLCTKHSIPLIEDSAQAWGTLIDNQSIFSEAFIATTSFYPGKVLGGAGDGGAVFTNDSNLAEKIRLLANHGRTGKYEHQLVGCNSRLDVLQCAYIDLSLDYINQRINSRRYAIQWYRGHLKNNALQIMSPALNVHENGYISVALIEPRLRNSLMQGLKKANIGYEVIYPKPISQQPGAKSWLAGSFSVGNTQKICEAIINLPCFAGITDAELEYVKYHMERLLK
jgi:dTDP-4-amino-4,6-dideoxygalactose transaminase